MAQTEDRTEISSVESILREIGPVKLDSTDVFAGPHDEDDENEIWLRKRAVLLRQVFEHYPSHEAALACLEQYGLLEQYQPFLFAETLDSLDAQEFETTGLYRRFDFSNEDFVSEWREAIPPIFEHQDSMASDILSKHPDLNIAEWAHRALVSSLGRQLLASNEGDIKEIVRLVDDLSDTVENYVRFRLDRHTSIEPTRGFFDGGYRQAVDFMIRAIDALQPAGRAAQSALLGKLSKMFPGNEEIENFSYRFHSFEKQFELSFADIVSGNAGDIQDYRGNIVIVDFWAMWCRPCLAFVPHLKKLLSNYPNDVKIIGISCDDEGLGDQATPEKRNKLEKRVVECAAEHGMEWPILLDYKLHRKWRIRSIPTVFVVDRRGILRSQNARTTLVETVRQLLDEDQTLAH